MSDPDRVLDRNQAAEYLVRTHHLRVAYGTLAQLAVKGGGPRFRKAGRFVRYSVGDLDQWALSKMSPVVSRCSELGRRCGT